MTEVLSNDEINDLFKQISSSTPFFSQDYSITELKDEKETATISKKDVKPYDFRKPDKFSKDQIRTLQMIHETFARMVTTSLSAQLRTAVQVHVGSGGGGVDQLTYEEFNRSIPSPTTLAIVNMDPLRGSAILEIDPNISYAIIDRLFGGKGELIKNINRELTDIERSVMENVIVRMLGNLRESWSTVVDLRPRLGNIETNPQFAQIVPPNDMVVLITFETKIAEVEGNMNFCIPYITIEPIVNKLSAQYWYSSIQSAQTEEMKELIQKRLEQIQLPIRCEVGEIELSILDVINLQVGDIVRLNTTINGEFIVKIGERKKFKCIAGRVGKRLAVQIGESIEDIPDELLATTKDKKE
ncbi:MAG: flagellar motor switch protein FliM [Leptospiraceae bacterium]|nr:flagellar motor switch protein FliM [Leptospiraceae bacterium]MDW7975435.1 flagellar motor switch protein FliM [Leptospiraceae bacterium]